MIRAINTYVACRLKIFQSHAISVLCYNILLMRDIMEQMRFFANCVRENCMARWNQEYTHEDDVSCPECEAEYITFENVEVLE